MKNLTKLIQSAGINVVPASGDISSPIDGDMWYNSTLAKFRAKENGVVNNIFSDLNQDNLIASVTKTINSNFGAVVPRRYLINSGQKLVIQSGGIFRIL